MVISGALYDVTLRSRWTEACLGGLFDDESEDLSRVVVNVGLSPVLLSFIRSASPSSINWTTLSVVKPTLSIPKFL